MRSNDGQKKKVSPETPAPPLSSLFFCHPFPPMDFGGSGGGKKGEEGGGEGKDRTNLDFEY